MPDVKRVPARPAWYPGNDRQWSDFVGPLIRSGRAESAASAGGIGLLRALPKDSYRAEGMDVRELFSSVINGEGWQSKLHGLESLFRPREVMGDEEVRMISVLRLLARITPESNILFMSALLEREGAKPVEIPSLSAVLAGVVPAHLMGKGAFAFALERISQEWFGGRLHEMARELGVDDFLLKSFIDGRGMPKSHERVVHIARKLGVDPDVLDVLWFADRYRKDVVQFIRQTHGKTSDRLRSRMINRIAAARLGEQFRPPNVMDNPIERSVDLAAFAMLARIHPRTVIPVIAARDEDNESFYDGVEEYAGGLARERGKPWKAAVACYLAANHAMASARLAQVKEFILKGNHYLRHGRSGLPQWLGPQQAAELRLYYLRRGLELYSVVADASPSMEVTSQLSYPPEAVAKIAGDIRDLAAEVPDNVSEAYLATLDGFDMRGWRRFESNLGAMTDGRRLAVERLMESCPTLMRAVVQSGKTSVLERAFKSADPKGERSAIPDMYFSRAVFSAAVKEGVVSADFGMRNTESDYIQIGDTIQFGGSCLCMTVSGLVPMMPIFPTAL